MCPPVSSPPRAWPAARYGLASNRLGVLGASVTDASAALPRQRTAGTGRRDRRRRDANEDAYPWIVKTTGVVNHSYVYAVDSGRGGRGGDDCGVPMRRGVAAPVPRRAARFG